jgi:hypothetical protein
MSAMSNAVIAVDLLGGMLETAAEVQAILQRAHAENRDVTDEELAELRDATDAARQRFDEAGQ